MERSPTRKAEQWSIPNTRDKYLDGTSTGTLEKLGIASLAGGMER